MRVPRRSERSSLAWAALSRLTIRPRILYSLAGFMLVFCGYAIADSKLPKLPGGPVFRDCANCPEMVVIPAGDFLMGSSDADTARDLAQITNVIIASDARAYMKDEHPQHLVRISKPFAMGRFFVTREQFSQFVNEARYSSGSGCTFFEHNRFNDHPDGSWENPGFFQRQVDPAVCISWQDAKAYIAWLNRKVNGNPSQPGVGSYRLPSESEWEYAARAGQETARWWGDDIGWNLANCGGCGSILDNRSTSPFGIFYPNPFGLFDMLGNAWELTEDCWHKNYQDAPLDGSAWTTGDDCAERVMRGGNWEANPWIVRSATRARASSPDHINTIGFRLVKTLP